MNIPDKYRERYDRLAASHPWMREMRDETETIGDLINQRTERIEERNHLIAKARNSFKSLADNSLDADRMRKGCRLAAERMDEEMERMGIDVDGRAIKTLNVIGGETNGIHADAPLVDEQPCTFEGEKVQGSGDAVSLMREAANDGLPIGHLITETDAADTQDAFARLADMIERDYVRREYHCKVVDDNAKLFAKVLDERDEWKAKAELLVSSSSLNGTGNGTCPDADGEQPRIAELQAERDKFSELAVARGRTIETLEHMLAERKGKYRDAREQMLRTQRNITAERDQYRELYEAAMSTSYATAARERDELHDQIQQIRSIVTDETPDDRLPHD